MTKPLRLRAETAEDLPTLSALIQDMAVRAHDIGYDPQRRRLVLLGNRFRWEAGNQAPHTRIRSALRIDFATLVQHRAMPDDPLTVLDLLAITVDQQQSITLSFAGGATIRAAIDSIDIFLDDLSEPWSARITPAHFEDEG